MKVIKTEPKSQSNAERGKPKRVTASSRRTHPGNGKGSPNEIALRAWEMTYANRERVLGNLELLGYHSLVSATRKAIKKQEKVKSRKQPRD
ncbi:MAG TPA: hypothetical protein VFB82_06605 [Blastocatellia bacterium]|nr:hypothetical protein [Blastocatellia bacterium]